METLLAHLWGDFMLQTAWMASQKAHASSPAIVHALVYTTPFVLLTQSAPALAVICISHFAIDRWQLAKLVPLFKGDSVEDLPLIVLKVIDLTIHLTINFFAIAIFDGYALLN